MDVKRLQDAIKTIELFRDSWADTVTEKEVCLSDGEEWNGTDQISDYAACNQIIEAMKHYIDEI